MLRILMSALLMLCFAPRLRAQSEELQWTGLHRIDIDGWYPVDSTEKSSAEITIKPDVTTHMEPMTSFCGVEFHGNSNLDAPKKSYGFEMRTEIGEEQKVALLGMAPGDDYVLLSCYYDRSFLRNVFTFALWKTLGHYTPDYRFCELYINGEYMGLYMLIERIKVDPGRMDLGVPPEQFHSGSWPTPPFLFRFDWNSPKSLSLGESLTGEKLHYRFDYPKAEHATASGYRYQSMLMEVERRFQEAVEKDTRLYRELIDLPSFADFLLVNELAKNPDGMKTSAFFYREYASKLQPTPPLKAGPVWDFDLAFDNVNYAQHNEIEGWTIDQFGAMSNAGMLPVWWHVLCRDSIFVSHFEERAAFLRGYFLGSGAMEASLRDLDFRLGPAIARDVKRWATTRGQWTNDLGPLQRTEAEDLERVLSFARNRMEWIVRPEAFTAVYAPLAAERAARTTLEVEAGDEKLRVGIWADSIRPETPLFLNCSVIDQNGQRVMEDWLWEASDDSLEIETAPWPSGTYFLEILPEGFRNDPFAHLRPVTSYAPLPVVSSATSWIPEPVLVQTPSVSWVQIPPFYSRYTSAPTPWDYRYMQPNPIRMHGYVKIVVE